MSIELDITGPDGNQLFFRSAENLIPRTHMGIEKALWFSAKDIHKEFNRQVLAKNKTGRLYIRKDKIGRRRRHIASAPAPAGPFNEGETPANRTGNYRRSFGFNVAKGTSPTLTIGNSAEYAGWLERGTRSGRLKPRPGLRNSIRSSERDILRNFTTEIAAEL